MKYEKITNIQQLKEKKFSDCFIHLGVARSSKEIEYEEPTKTFIIWHSIDDTYQELSTHELLQTNIGKAIKQGNFYRRVYEKIN